MWDEVLLFFVPFRSQFFMLSLFSGERQWPFGPLVDFSSETAEWNSRKLDRKHDLNVLYHVCIIWADQETKMAALADSSNRSYIVLRCTICGPLGLLFFLGTLTLQVDLLLKKKLSLTWLLNHRGHLLLLFTYGCRRRAMLSLWQLWFLFALVHVIKRFLNEFSYSIQHVRCIMNLVVCLMASPEACGYQTTRFRINCMEWIFTGSYKTGPPKMEVSKDVSFVSVQGGDQSTHCSSVHGA